MERFATEIITVSRETIDEGKILRAAEAILSGRIVVFPTETVYGVGCRYDDESARDRLFALKGRDRTKPLAIYVLSVSEIGEYAVLPPTGEKLARAFLPGPLTLVLPRTEGEKLGFRIPSDEVARRLIRLGGVPLAGTSANLSGQESPTDGQQAIAAMEGRVDFIIDGGKTEYGCDSTVMDLSLDPPVVLREGAVSAVEISGVLGFDVRKSF